MATPSDPWAWADEDERIEWRPGGKRAATIQSREANNADLYVIRSVLRDRLGVRVSTNRVRRWLNFHGYIVRVATRNNRNIVALCISSHFGRSNRVLHYWADTELYPTSGWTTGRLLLLAALELPEVETSISLPADDDKTATILHGLGWKATHVSHDDGPTERGTIDFTRPGWLLPRPPLLRVPEGGGKDSPAK